MIENEAQQNPRVIIIQKLYTYYLNKESEITFPKHKFKKFIKDVVKGTIERKDLIQGVIDKELKNDVDEKFPAITHLPSTVEGGTSWYLFPENRFGLGLYQEEASVFDEGHFEILVTSIESTIEKLIDVWNITQG